jgi:hypothetical protein
LEGARQDMLRAAGMLVRGQTDSAAQQAAQEAATRLEQMLAALEPDDSPPPAAPPCDQSDARAGPRQFTDEGAPHAGGGSRDHDHSWMGHRGNRPARHVPRVHRGS